MIPPKTWKQYLDIAEFFQRPDKGLWGTAEAFRRGGQQFWFFFSHAAAYTNNPNYPGAMFFDPETMDAQINNPGWLKGLEEYIRASKLGPPNALNFSFGEVNAAVAGGQVAAGSKRPSTLTPESNTRQPSVQPISMPMGFLISWFSLQPTA